MTDGSDAAIAAIGAMSDDEFRAELAAARKRRRNRTSAKKAGTSWETAIVGVLQQYGYPHAERRRLSGARDRGDIAGVPGICIEAKNTNRLEVAAAVDEANVEALNANAPVGVAWFKRKGKSSPLDGYVVMSGDTFLRLIQETE